jgi:hypothetical protein
LLCRGTRRTDILLGFRAASLDESITIVEDLQQITVLADNLTAPIQPGNQIDVVDAFATSNDFVGGDIGYETQWEHRRWSLNLLTKVAIGNTRQRVAINGSTVIDDEMGTVTSSPGGLLTQRFEETRTDPDPDVTTDDFVVGNIGSYERDEFSMIPEIGLTLGYNITPRLKFTAGYTLLYWSNIVRPGDQIDLDVNANLLQRNGPPAAGTVVVDDHPRFVFRQTDLWAQGLNLGAEYSW